MNPMAPSKSHLILLLFLFLFQAKGWAQIEQKVPYNPSANAKADIEAMVKQANADGKHVLPFRLAGTGERGASVFMIMYMKMQRLIQ
jgi:hypothetical protein